MRSVSEWVGERWEAGGNGYKWASDCEWVAESLCLCLRVSFTHTLCITHTHIHSLSPTLTTPCFINRQQSHALQSDVRSDVFTWGANINFILGHADDSNRAKPHRVPFDKVTRYAPVGVAAVATDKFHTLFLLTDGRVFACGHGQHGRFGACV